MTLEEGGGRDLILASVPPGGAVTLSWDEMKPLLQAPSTAPDPRLPQYPPPARVPTADPAPRTAEDPTASNAAPRAPE